LTAIRSSRWLWFGMISSLTIMITACSTLPTPTLRATNVPDPTGVPGPANIPDPTGVPGPTDVPGSSDVLATTEISGATVTPEATDVPKTTSTPEESSLENHSSEELFRDAMVAMHNLQSFHLSRILEKQHGVGIGEGTIEGAQSGERSRLIYEPAVSGGVDGYIEIICIPPYLFTRGSDDGDWYRQGIEEDDGECSFVIASSVVIFPNPGLPLGLYDFTFLGIDEIAGVPTKHMRVNGDWPGIGNWLEEEGHMAGVASHFNMSVEEVEDIYFEDPYLVEVWIDEYGFMNKMVIKDREDDTTATWHFSAFNLPISIEPPTQFKEGPPPSPEEAPLTRTAGSWSVPNLEISVVPATLQVGETAVVTVTVSGQGGLPQYTLYVDSAILKVTTPNTLSYSNFSTVPQWTIEAVGVGSTSFSVGMSYETQTCSDGACYYNFTSTGSPSVVVEVVEATTSRGAGKIAFFSDRDGYREIYNMNADGSNQTRLTFGEYSDVTPQSWSPKDARMVFNSDRDGNFQIYAMNVDRHNQGLVFLGGPGGFDVIQVAWSPDGARVAYSAVREGNLEIYTMNANGSNGTRLTFNDTPDRFPAWSPDGARIAFSTFRDGGSQIYTMNADGSNQTRLTFNGSGAFPAWSHDGARIVFNSDRDGNIEIYTMNADGSNQTRLTFNDSSELLPAWSPDGARIAFASDRDGNLEIYTMNADGSNQTRLTFDEADDFQPAWSP